MGGLIAAISKYGAFEHEALIEIIHMHSTESDEARTFRLALYLSSCLLMLIGGFIAYAIDEDNRMKLLAIGASAPALIAPWAAQIEKARSDRPAAALTLPLISTALADNETNTSSDNARALRFLLGLGSDKQSRFWVIAGSHSSYEAAAAQVEVINRSDPTLEAFVGTRKPGNQHFPVIIGGPKAFLPLPEARKLLKAARESPHVAGSAFLSNYAGRLGNPVAPPP